jgi:hypothetical protein
MYTSVKEQMKSARQILKSTLRLVLLLALLNAGVRAVAQTETKAVSDLQTTLRGHFLADFTFQFSGAGVGPKWETFIFGVEQADGRTRPIRIAYAYYGQRLPSAFLDYTKRYELKAIREKSCDESVNGLSWVKNVDTSGRELAPTYVLRVLKGAPNVLLRPQLTLQCYIVSEGHLRLVPGQ